ncbi:MAG: CpsD/CapB family tyrosine-protein kinase [Tepidiformaceae bacterium]
MRELPTIDTQTRRDLEEAIREVHVIAGLDMADHSDTGYADRGARAPRIGRRSIAVGVTSPDYGDGKTTIAIALAASLSHDFGTNVTLVDADFHTHSVERQYGLEGQVGFAEVLAGTTVLPDATHDIVEAAMHVVPAGLVSADPARLARSDRLGPAVDQMKSGNSHVVFDLPATLHSMNAPALAQRCDAVIVVARSGRTTRQQLDRTLHLLRDANVIGVVMNRQRSSIPAWVQRTLGVRT